MRTPWEWISGIATILCILGIIVLDILGRKPDPTLVALAVAGAAVYNGARNYNAGDNHGRTDGKGSNGP